MTDKEKVLKVHPDARVLARIRAHKKFYGVVSKGLWLQPATHETEEAAWQNAAESLPAQPEQWIELTSDALRFGNKPPVIRCFDCKSEGGFHKANCRDTSRYEVPVEAKEKKIDDSFHWCRFCGKVTNHNPKTGFCLNCDGLDEFADPKPTPFTPTERVNNPYKLPWEAMAGSIIDTVHMTPEDYVNEKLVEQLKRYFVPQTDSSSISSEPEQIVSDKVIEQYAFDYAGDKLINQLARELQQWRKWAAAKGSK